MMNGMRSEHIVIVCLLALSPSVSAESKQAPWNRDRLAGDGFGTLPSLTDRGIDLEIALVSDLAKSLRGGLSTNGWNTGYLFDAALTLDTGRFGLWDGGTFLAYFICQNGEFASADIGDLQVADNIDADGRTALYELWYQHVLADGAIRIKVGKIDANGDFDALECAGDFIHSSPGSSPTVLGLPTYADPATGGLIFLQPNEHLYLGLGVFDGAAQEGFTTGTRGPSTFFGSPADLFLIGEGGVRWTLAGKKAGRAAIGLWRHTGTFDRFDGGTDHGTCGFYFLAEQRLWNDADRSLDAFVQYGWADQHISSIAHHIGLGIALTGPFSARRDDVLGLMGSCALLSNDPAAGFDDDAEVAVELFYKAQVLPWLSVQPDLQYIANPGGTADIDDALAFILRVVIDI